jgi:hypothetical protein
MGIEILIGVLVAGLAFVTVMAAYLGTLGLFGASGVMRCAQCGHLTLTSSSTPPSSCHRCRQSHSVHRFVSQHWGSGRGSTPGLTH